MQPLYSTDREVLETAVHWLGEGRRVALVTVAKTWGSSPRPVGALMLMCADGSSFGSVSGGCVEEDLSMRFQTGQLGDEFPTLIDYGIERAAAPIRSRCRASPTRSMPCPISGRTTPCARCTYRSGSGVR